MCRDARARKLKMAESLEELAQPPNAMPQNSSSWLDYLFGPTLHQQTGHQQVYGSGADRRAFTAQDWSKYPNYSDIDASKQHDLSYGDPSAGFFSPGAKMDELSLNQVMQQGNKGKEFIGKSQPISQKHADELHQAWLATKRSPVAYLGFDPRTATTSPVDTGQLTVDGLYAHSATKAAAEEGKPHNSIWYNRENHPALVHESVHKGLKAVLASPE